jgi:UDP-2-acetamido-3-amino-2,3-dideoxy-glucuronate N-acetyltransferase
MSKNVKIHHSATVSSKCRIGDGTIIWAYAQLRENAIIGRNCVVGNGVYVDKNVKIGNNVVIQNKSLLYRNIVINDDVFIGPGVIFTNDKNPRSHMIRDLESISWEVGKGASIGASSTILPDINIGEYAMIGASSLVTRDIPKHALVFGSPAKVQGYVCYCGERLELMENEIGKTIKCIVCEKEININEP